MLWVVIPSIIIFVVVFTQIGGLLSTLLNYYNIPVVSLSPSESIEAMMNLSLAAALLFFIPAFVYQMFSFSKELIPQKTYKGVLMRSLFGFVLTFGGFFVGITYFGKLVLNGLMTYNIGVPMWSLATVLKLTCLLGVGLAISMQMTWFIPVITKSELIKKKDIKKLRPFLIVGIMIISALVTPPDVYSMFLMMIPLYGSFEVGLLFSKRTQEERRRLMQMRMMNKSAKILMKEGYLNKSQFGFFKDSSELMYDKYPQELENISMRLNKLSMEATKC